MVNIVFSTHKSNAKHHIAQRTASQWLLPFACFGLTLAPKKTQGHDRKYTVKKKVHRKAATDMQRAVSQDGGITVV